MRLSAPAEAPRLDLMDIHGNRVRLGRSGRRTLLCFFGDAACPFCNVRIDVLTHRYREWNKRGLDVVTVFASSRGEVQRFVARQPRPFTLVADPAAGSYLAYGIEISRWRKVKAVLMHMPTLLTGLRTVGLAGLKTNDLVPADFLIDEKGRIVDAAYGSDVGDHMPLQRVDRFVARDVMQCDAPERGRLEPRGNERVAVSVGAGS